MIPRRRFLARSLAALAATSLRLPRVLAMPSARPAAPPPPLTVRRVIDALLADIPGAPFPNTVDTIKAGDPSQPVKGIVTAMFATDAVIPKTIGLGANFIIAHEPTFYNHTDETGWLGEWETSEYVRDARFQGRKIALVVLGPCVSEEPGLEWLLPVLARKAPGIRATHIPSGDAFSWT